MSSSIIEYVYENGKYLDQFVQSSNGRRMLMTEGRHYHRKSADQYVMPSDAEEQDRLDLMVSILN